jgi:hypothetical protein
MSGVLRDAFPIEYLLVDGLLRKFPSVIHEASYLLLLNERNAPIVIDGDVNNTISRKRKVDDDLIVLDDNVIVLDDDVIVLDDDVIVEDADDCVIVTKEKESEEDGFAVEAEDAEQEVEGSMTAMERNDLRKSLDRSFNP